jgi:3-deoxy-manno-octulosonate cytidylyltransferase (CMP-KDO synthetase)
MVENASLKIMAVIPVRFEARRLPGKPLLDVAGKTLLERVFEAADKTNLFDDVKVATDSKRIFQFCLENEIPAMLTGAHRSGTDRVYEVMDRTHADVYVNIQGDEPTLRPEHIDLLTRPFRESNAQVTTLKVKISGEAAKDPNTVKVVTDLREQALYFSRSPIPYDRDAEGKVAYFKHLGVYGYRREALVKFHSLPQSSLEKSEKLEQLRFLENGIPIHVKETLHDTIGVDTEEDLRKAIEYFSRS